MDYFTRTLTYIPPNDDIAVTLQQLSFLEQLLKKSTRIDLTGPGYTGNSSINPACHLFDFNDCGLVFSCTESPALGTCYAVDDTENRKAIISTNYNTIFLNKKKFQQRMHTMKCIFGRLNSLKVYSSSSLCIKVSDEYVRKATQILDYWGLNSKPFGVVHWPVREACYYNNDFDYDFSINCFVSDFKDVISEFVKHYSFPIYVATNEIKYDLLPHGNERLFSQFDLSDEILTTSELNVIEFVFMEKSQYLWGAGNSPVHFFLNSLRSQKNLSSFSSLPGSKNTITDGIPKVPALEFLLNTTLNLKNNLIPNVLDSILICFHINDIYDGKMEHLFSEMKSLSREGHRPSLFFAAAKFFKPEQQSIIMKLLNKFRLREKFSNVEFLNLAGYQELEISDTKKGHRLYSAYEGPNGVFYESMSSLSKYNISTVLILEPDVKFVHNFWFDGLYKLCQADNFWIQGSNYRGSKLFMEDKHWHLNGVALYNVKDPYFQEFLSVQMAFHIFYETKDKLNYDVVWAFMKELLIKSFPNNTDIVKKIRRIQNNFLTTNAIVNFSPLADMNTTQEEIVMTFPNVLLIHQKSNTIYQFTQKIPRNKIHSQNVLLAIVTLVACFFLLLRKKRASKIFIFNDKLF